jgi:hypothetical protein
MIVVLDKVIPTTLEEKIKDIINAYSFTWEYLPRFNDNIKSISDNTFQYNHVIFNNNKACSEFSAIFTPLLYFFEDKFNIEILNIYRVKVNTLLKAASNVVQPPHVDHPSSKYVSIVYYVDDCEGDTIVYNENISFFKGKAPVILESNNGLTEARRISPKKGRAVMFNSTTYHSASSPCLNDRRLVINTVVEIK